MAERSPKDMKSELQTGFEDLKNRESALKSQEEQNKINIEQMRAETIQSLMDLLKEYGVDGSNLESISAFLYKLRDKDPDLAELFEIAFNDLMNNSQPEPEETAPNAGLMNKFKNLAPEVMRPTE